MSVSEARRVSVDSASRVTPGVTATTPCRSRAVRAVRPVRAPVLAVGWRWEHRMRQARRGRWRSTPSCGQGVC